MLRKIITVFIIVCLVVPLVVLAMHYCGVCQQSKTADNASSLPVADETAAATAGSADDTLPSENAADPAASPATATEEPAPTE